MRGLADLSLSFCGIVDRGKGCVTSTNLQFDNGHLPSRCGTRLAPQGQYGRLCFLLCSWFAGGDAILLNGVLLGANRRLPFPGEERADRGSAVLYLTCRLNTR